MGWKAVSKDLHLYRRDDAFYVRRRVPTDLRQAFGREFFIKALNASSLSEAKAAVGIANVEFERRLGELRTAQAPVVEAVPVPRRKLDQCSAAEIETMVGTWFRDLYHSNALQFSDNNPFRDVPDKERETPDIEDDLRSWRQAVQLLHLPDVPNLEDLLAGQINSVIRRNNLEFQFQTIHGLEIKTRLQVVADPSGWRYKLFMDFLRRATIALYEQEIAQWSGVIVPSLRPELEQVLSGSAQGARKTVVLAQLMEEFLADRRRENMRMKVAIDYRFLFRIMGEAIGEGKLLRDIDRDDCKAVRDLVSRLPAHANKLYPKLTLKQAAERGTAEGQPRLKQTTINSYLEKMSALFNYAVREERMDRNPAQKLAENAAQHTEVDRYPFSEDQLKAIFSAPIFTGCKNGRNGWAVPGSEHPKEAKYWIPLIALYQGMRLNEICQLSAEDFRSSGGIHYFHVRPINGNRVKTEAGERKVPLHPKLEQLGFLDYHAQILKDGKDRLFPELKQDGRGYFSDGFQKWFSRLLDKQNARAPKTSFHSFRHCWRDAVREAGIPQERVRLLGGWKRTAVDERYGSNLSLKTLKEEVEKVRYPALDAVLR